VTWRSGNQALKVITLPDRRWHFVHVQAWTCSGSPVTAMASWPHSHVA
jgi:hypothetical protein